MPRTIRADFDGMWLRPDWAAIPADAELVAGLVDEADRLTKATRVAPEQAALDFVQLSERGSHRVVLRLLRAGEVLDELELPRLEEVDIAAGAAVPASNPHVGAGAHPESVVGQDGNWQFAWNDEPRPGWIELAWRSPQTFNHVGMTFAQAEYSSRDCEVFVSDDVMGYIIKLAEETRKHPDIILGVSPRGTQALLKASQICAILSGREFVTPDDVAEGIATVNEVAASYDREIEDEHFGVLIPYANGPLDDRVLGFLAARRPEIDPRDLVASSPAGLVELIERFVTVGASKFVAVPFAPMGDVTSELEELAAIVRPLEN